MSAAAVRLSDLRPEQAALIRALLIQKKGPAAIVSPAGLLPKVHRHERSTAAS